MISSTLIENSTSEVIFSHRVGASTISDGKEYYIEGVKCSNCLKKIYSLETKFSDIESIGIDMSQNILTLKTRSPQSLGLVLDEIKKLGFGIQPITGWSQSKELEKLEDRKFLLQLGVAGACAGNIMLLAVSLYAGAGIEFQSFFRWLCFVLALPVIFYSAQPLYRGALLGLRSKIVTVDLPIVVAVLSGFILSILGLINDQETLYFDSISALVFLVLSTRYLLIRIQRKYLNSRPLKSLFNVQNVVIVKDTTEISQPLESLKRDMVIRVYPGQIVPVDGHILKGSSYVQNAYLTGEFVPTLAQAGDIVYAGGRVENGTLDIHVDKLLEECRLQTLLKQLDQVKKSDFSKLLDKVGQYFLYTVLVVSTLILVYHHNNLIVGFQRALAFLLVTCPCTIAFAVPLAYSMGIRRAAEFGILIRTPNVFERLQKIKKIYFDKTGTLTDGQYSVTQWDVLQPLPPEFLERVKGLAMGSFHPISKAIARYIEAPAKQSFDTIQETPTRGIIGIFQTHKIEICNSDIQGFVGTVIKYDDRVIVRAVLTDQILANTSKAIQKLNQLGKEIFLITGDNEENARTIAHQVGITPPHILFKQTPEEKQKIIQSNLNTMMVGDGVNDVLALKQADVGVAVNGSLDVSFRSADVYLSSGGLERILTLFQLSDGLISTIKRNLTIAVIYNIVAGSLAVLGIITPLLAAILMPLSSVTQTLSSLWVMKKRYS